MDAGSGTGRDSLLTRTLTSIEKAVRFALPYWASVVVVNLGDPEVLALLDRERRPRWEFPRGRPAKGEDQSREMITELELLRAEGWDYLLVPAMALGWLEQHGRFKQHLEREYRVVCKEDTCLIFGLATPDQAGSRTAPDELPLPPPEMIGLVGGAMEPKSFFESGARAATWIAELLEANGRSIRDVDDLLDFGCGCGRVIRHWKAKTGARLRGTDYNPYLIDWCRANLPFAEFELNTLESPLSYPDETFDLAYALSVFTHLRESLQRLWIKELTRVLRPGGLLLLTVHGRRYTDWLTSEEAERFESGQLVVRGSELSGSDFCATFHPERYVGEVLGQELEMLDYSVAPTRDSHQDGALFLKP
jgi:SAM-dependent methyltransferase